MLNWQKWILGMLSLAMVLWSIFSIANLAFNPAISNSVLTLHEAALQDIVVSDFVLIFLLGSFGAGLYFLKFEKPDMVFWILLGGSVIVAVLSQIDRIEAATLSAPIRVIMFGFGLGILLKILWTLRRKAQI